MITRENINEIISEMTDVDAAVTEIINLIRLDRVNQKPESNELLDVFKEMNNHIEDLYHVDCNISHENIQPVVIKRDVVLAELCKRNDVDLQKLISEE